MPTRWAARVAQFCR